MNLHASATFHLYADISLNMLYVAQHASTLAYRLLLPSIPSTPCEIPEINFSRVPCSSPHCLTKLSLPGLRVCTNPIFRGGTYICYTICECYQSHSVLASLRGGMLSVPLNVRSYTIVSKAIACSPPSNSRRQGSC